MDSNSVEHRATAVSNSFLFSASVGFQSSLMMKGFGVRKPRTVNSGKILVKKKRREWERGKVLVECEEGWFDGFIVNWFLASGGVVRIVLDGIVVGVDLVGTGGWKSFFLQGGSCFGGVLGQSFLEFPSPLSLLFKLSDISIDVAMEESFVGFFYLFAFLVCLWGLVMPVAKFNTSISASFSGFSFVVSVVWTFFWGRLSRGGRAVCISRSAPPCFLPPPSFDEYIIWNSLKALSSQTNPEYIVTLRCPGSGLQLWYIRNAAVGAEEWG